MGIGVIRLEIENRGTDDPAPPQVKVLFSLSMDSIFQ